jgi:hypothetical protein
VVTISISTSIADAPVAVTKSGSCVAAGFLSGMEGASIGAGAGVGVAVALAASVDTGDRVVAKAVSDGVMTAEQSKSGLWAAFKAPEGDLFLCVCATDRSGLVVGTSVPKGSWWMKK